MPGQLSRQQMEAAINAGGSVMIHNLKGRDDPIFTRVEDLPPESELAGGDRDRARAALEAHDHQIARLVAERQKLARVAEGEPRQPPGPAPVQAQPALEGPADIRPRNAPGTPPPGPAPEQQRAEAPPPPADEPPPPPREEDDRPGLFGKKRR
jgi:hypothetical protein